MERSNDCPECGRPLTRMRNPYLGAGLAVHEWVDACEHCGTLVYVPTVTERAVVAPPSRWQRILRRLKRIGLR